ncbi:uncharacterized protein LOC118194378 [Stegodyphus dumicola]|uniref:uncharacterized protein LOC118194378 n=1 Tax=Stegodyphus dumicola TaxID=202533 RepID=UPI0015B05CC0|nr:uncharacterized protein LOC118194378 [Stegodyphus dumicola]XP_035221420.1 uncharacterized protein LOC118194378 [Stegodyphus dumicola]
MATDERTAMVEELKFSPYTSFFGTEDLISSPIVKEECDNSEIMKLPTKDMGLFGYCPVYDDVCLVICNNCRRSIKPQAIESHRKKCITNSSDSHKTSASLTQINQINSRISEGAKLSNTGRNDKKDTYSSSSNNGVPFNHSIDQILSAKVVVRKLSPTGESIKNSSQKLSPIEESIRSNSSVLPHYQYLPSTSGPGPGDHSISRTFRFSNSGIISDSYVNIKNFSSETLSNISPVVVLNNTIPINSALTTIKTENLVKQFKAKEFNPDQHCGVPLADGNPCVKALTCKQHRSALRRAVPGRSKELDVLIKEQKARRKVASTKLMQNNSCANSVNFQNEKRTSMEFQSLNCIPNNCIKICLEPSELQNYERTNCVPFSRNGNESCLLLPTEDSCNQSALDSVQPLDYGPCVEPTIDYGPCVEPTIDYGPCVEPTIDYGPPAEPAIDYGPPAEPAIGYECQAEPAIGYGCPVEPAIEYETPTEPKIDYGPLAESIIHYESSVEPTICQTESTNQLPNSIPQEELRNSLDCGDFKTGCLASSCASQIETCDTFCELNNCTENSIKIPEIENLPEIEPTVSSQADVKSPSPAPSWNRTSSPSAGGESVTDSCMLKDRPETKAALIRKPSQMPHIIYHPRPSAICTYGMRETKHGLVLTSYRSDSVREALQKAIEEEKLYLQRRKENSDLSMKSKPACELAMSSELTHSLTNRKAVPKSELLSCNVPEKNIVSTFASKPSDIICTTGSDILSYTSAFRNEHVSFNKLQTLRNIVTSSGTSVVNSHLKAFPISSISKNSDRTTPKIVQRYINPSYVTGSAKSPENATPSKRIRFSLPQIYEPAAESSTRHLTRASTFSSQALNHLIAPLTFNNIVHAKTHPKESFPNFEINKLNNERKENSARKSLLTYVGGFEEDRTGFICSFKSRFPVSNKNQFVCSFSGPCELENTKVNVTSPRRTLNMCENTEIERTEECSFEVSRTSENHSSFSSVPSKSYNRSSVSSVVLTSENKTHSEQLDFASFECGKNLRSDV